MQIKPKKSLGQNFLTDKNIIKLIVKLGNIKENDIVVEVGPGTGNLTSEILLQKPEKLLLVEKDNELTKKLANKFKDKINIINDDILKVKLEKIIKKRIIIFGNLPYNISTQILVKWIRLKNLNSFCKKFILMFQKEVADRIVAEANNKNYGRLSILCSWKMNTKKIKDIHPNSFFPSPKVESTILVMEPKKKVFNINNPKNLEFITSVFFNQRRKMIKKPLNLIFKNPKKIATKFNLNLSNRPQNLKPSIYFNLCKEYEDLMN